MSEVREDNSLDNNDIQIETSKIIERRTEKHWRHEDRELTSSHSLWNVYLIFQGIITSAAGVLFSQSGSLYTIIAFVLILIISLFAVFSVIKLFSLLRNYDSLRSEYFRQTSKGYKIYSKIIVKEAEEEKINSALNEYKNKRGLLEKINIFLFFISSIIFSVVIILEIIKKSCQNM